MLKASLQKEIWPFGVSPSPENKIPSFQAEDDNMERMRNVANSLRYSISKSSVKFVGRAAPLLTVLIVLPRRGSLSSSFPS
jgi:hypothetical protein